MTFTVEASPLWKKEWPNYLPKQREGVEAFLAVYLIHGLHDQRRYPGRLSPSWHGLPPNDPQHVHAQSSSLWHYHIGYPAYSGGYSSPRLWGQTSDDLMHFQWVGDHIKLIELSAHRVRGRFYLPSAQSIADPAVSAPVAPLDPDATTP
jgi:hypothetical protein